MKLSEALTAIAERAAFASEQDQRDALAAIDRAAARLDGDDEPAADDRVSLTPAGAAATSSARKRAPAKKRAAPAARQPRADSK